MNRDQEMRTRLQSAANEWQMMRSLAAVSDDPVLAAQARARTDELEAAAYAHYRLLDRENDLRVAVEILEEQTAWRRFGTHQDGPVSLEFRGEDEVGMPIFERPVS